jgi:hypothetical protein
MTTNHHTPIATGAAANAATFNGPLSQLDTAVTARARVWAGKTTAPTVNDDSGDGIAVGDRWIDETNNREYVCLDATAGAAVWVETAIVLPTLIEGMQLIWNSATSLSVGIGKCYAENGDLIDATSTIVKSSLSLSASTWYHVYVYLSGGSPAAEVVTTAPALWKGIAYRKTGDTSRRYVGSIKTDGSGNVYEFLHTLSMNMIHYKNVNTIASPFRCLSAGTATTATAVPLSGVVPVTSRLAQLRFYNGGTQAAYVNESNAVSTTIYLVASLANIGQEHATHPLDGSQQVWYLVTSGGSLYIDVAGYHFNR